MSKEDRTINPESPALHGNADERQGDRDQGKPRFRDIAAETIANLIVEAAG